MRGLARGHVDVAIIGTGLTSLSAALYLARKNAKAQVFEKRRGQIRRAGTSTAAWSHRKVSSFRLELE